MLAPEHRLRSSAMFREVVKRGSRKGSRTVVVHLWTPHPTAESGSPASDTSGEAEGAAQAGAGPGELPPCELPLDAPLVTFGGPRAGLVVSKAVGNAVVRHAVSRRLRAALDSILRENSQATTPQLPRQAMLVVRALPASAKASTKEVEADVRKCLHRLSK